MFKSLFFIAATLASMFGSTFFSQTKIGFVIGPKYNFAHTLGKVITTSYNYSENGSLGYGINMISKVNDRIALSYGVMGTINRIERKDKCISCDVEVAQTNNLQYRYITLPFQGLFYFQNNRLDIFGIAGLEYNYLLKSKGSYVTNTGGSYELNTLRNTTSTSLFGIEAGVGIDYNISYRGSFRLNLTYQYFVNAMTSSPTSYLRTLYIQPGIYYQF